MSVIAWDGRTLAADRRASVGSLILVTKKIAAINGNLVGCVGDAGAGEELLAWWRGEAMASDFPAALRDQDLYAALMVVHRDGTILKWEHGPYPIEFPPQQFAMGSGRNFAMAAMACGKSAAEAVEITCRLDSSCGNGVDTLTHCDAERAA